MKQCSSVTWLFICKCLPPCQYINIIDYFLIWHDHGALNFLFNAQVFKLCLFSTLSCIIWNTHIFPVSYSFMRIFIDICCNIQHIKKHSSFFTVFCNLFSVDDFIFCWINVKIHASIHKTNIYWSFSLSLSLCRHSNFPLWVIFIYWNWIKQFSKKWKESSRIYFHKAPSNFTYRNVSNK